MAIELTVDGKLTNLFDSKLTVEDVKAVTYQEGRTATKEHFCVTQFQNAQRLAAGIKQAVVFMDQVAEIETAVQGLGHSKVQTETEIIAGKRVVVLYLDGK